MTKKRTKEQVAFDGVRMSWQSDPFTEILNHQVRTQFSIDGVVAPKGGVVSSEKSVRNTYVVSVKRKNRRVLPVVNTGVIRLLSWKKGLAA